MTQLTNEENIILSALIVSKKPLDIEQLSKLIDQKNETVKKIINDINTKLEKLNFALYIYELPSKNKYDIQIKPVYYEKIEHFAPKPELSRSLLKTLAIIAYKSPIKQKDLIEIRGSQAYEHIKELKLRKLIVVEKKGNSNIIKITKNFLEYFGLKSPDEIKKFFDKFGKEKQ